MPRDLFADDPPKKLPRDLFADDPPTVTQPQPPAKTIGDYAATQEKALGEAYKKARGYDAGVDYTSGVQDASLRASLARMDTPAEKAGWLNTNVGQAGEFWGQDSAGRLALTPKGLDRLGIKHKGKPVAIDAPTLELGDLAEMAGKSGPALGAGIAAGALTGGLGTIPAMLATGVAAGGAKAIDEGVEKLQGYQQQSGAEVATDALTEGLTQATGEGAVRALRPFGRLALGPYRQVNQPFNPLSRTGKPTSVVDPERIKLMNEALAEGFRPSIGTIQGKAATLFPALESAANWIGITNPVDEVNRKVVLAGRDKLLAAAGDAVAKPGEGAEKAVLGRLASGERRVAGAVKAEEDATSAVQDAIKKNLGGTATAEEAGTAVQESIKAARAQFAKEASARYSEWDAATGGKPVFNTGRVKRVAQDWLDKLPGATTTKQVQTGVLDASGKPIVRAEAIHTPISAISPEGVSTLKGIMAADDQMTAAQMQNLRTTLREAAYDPNMLPGVPKKIQRDMLRAVDDSMESSGLQDVNRWYREGISKFDDARILRMTKDASKSGAIDPEQIVDFAVKPGKEALIGKVKALTPTPAWQKVQQAHYASLVQDATGPDGKLESMKLAKSVNDLGASLDQVYGRTQAQQIRSLSKELMVADGKLDPSLLQGGDLADAIRNRLAVVAKQEQDLKDNFVQSVTARNFDPGRLTGMLLKPDNSRYVESAKGILGEKSPEWNALRADAMRRVMDDMIIQAGPMGDYTTQSFSGGALKEALNKYGGDTTKAIFGPELSGRLEGFANRVAFVTAKQKLGAGALNVAGIAVSPLKHKARLAELMGMRWLLTRPSFIRFMTEGYEAKGARAMADTFARVVAQGSPHLPWEDLAGQAESEMGLTPE